MPDIPRHPAPFIQRLIHGHDRSDPYYCRRAASRVMYYIAQRRQFDRDRDGRRSGDCRFGNASRPFRGSGWGGYCSPRVRPDHNAGRLICGCRIRNLAVDFDLFYRREDTVPDRAAGARSFSYAVRRVPATPWPMVRGMRSARRPFDGGGERGMAPRPEAGRDGADFHGCQIPCAESADGEHH